MAKKTGKSKKKRAAKKAVKKEEPLECFYCKGLVYDWNWRCPHCGKLFNSGKRAIALFVAVVIISAVIGTYPIWYEPPKEPWPLEIDKVHPENGYPEAWIYSKPDVWFNQTHTLHIPLNKEKCKKAFSITPELDGYVFWAGFVEYEHIMGFFPNNMLGDRWEGWLQPNTTYHITLTKECQDIEGNRIVGNQPDGSYYFWFTTQPNWPGEEG